MGGMTGLYCWWTMGGEEGMSRKSPSGGGGGDGG